MQRPDANALPAYLLARGSQHPLWQRQSPARSSRANRSSCTPQTHCAKSRIVLTVIASKPDQYADLALDTIADTAPDHGPVQGLLEALIHRLEHHGEGWLILAACDMLTPDATPYLELLDALPYCPQPCGALAFRTDRWHPMPGLYHTVDPPVCRSFSRRWWPRVSETARQKNHRRLHPTHRHRPLAKLIHANTPDQLKQGLARNNPNTSNTPRDKA